MSSDELKVIDNIISELNTKKSIADSIMEEVEALKASIRDKMINFGVDNITTPNHYITYRECERTSIDKKRLKTEFPELFSTLSKVSKYMVLRIN